MNEIIKSELESIHARMSADSLSIFPPRVENTIKVFLVDRGFISIEETDKLNFKFHYNQSDFYVDCRNNFTCKVFGLPDLVPECYFSLIRDMFKDRGYEFIINDPFDAYKPSMRLHVESLAIFINFHFKQNVPVYTEYDIMHYNLYSNWGDSLKGELMLVKVEDNDFLLFRTFVNLLSHQLDYVISQV